MQKTTAVLALILLSLTCSVLAQPTSVSQIVLEDKNSKYTVTHDPAAGRITCASDNAGCVWQATVAESIPTVLDFAAIATPGGPVFIFNQSNVIRFAMLHFQTGQTVTPVGDAPLSGVIGSGRLHSAQFLVGDYGAKAKVIAISGGNQLTYSWDINVHGASKALADPVSEPLRARVVSESAGLSFAIPRGFDCKETPQGAEFYGPAPQVRMILLGLQVDASLDEFTALLLEELGKELGLKETSRQQLEIAEDMPGLLLSCDGNVSGHPAQFAVLTVGNGVSKYVAVYGAAPDRFDVYLGAFIELLNSLELE